MLAKILAGQGVARVEHFSISFSPSLLVYNSPFNPTAAAALPRPRCGAIPGIAAPVPEWGQAGWWLPPAPAPASFCFLLPVFVGMVGKLVPLGRLCS